MEHLLEVFLVHWKIVVFFFFIASLYSSVGFGGGSSYLAILAWFSTDLQVIRIIALICNIVVVSSAILIYYNRGLLKLKRVIPLVLLSIPLAFLGGRIQLHENIFFLLLSFTLIVASILMMWQKLHTDKEFTAHNGGSLRNAAIGGGIGFLSGLVGIGGGIFLAPVLHLLKWDKPKMIAAAASFFIFVNSIAGLGGQLSIMNNFDIQLPLLLAITVFAGAQVGSRLGSGPFTQNTVKLMTAFLILFVGIRIALNYLPLMLS